MQFVIFAKFYFAVKDKTINFATEVQRSSDSYYNNTLNS